LVAFTLMANFIMLFWIEPRWWITPSELVTFMKLKYPEREVTPAAMISPKLWLARGSPITHDAGMLREKTVGAGAVVAFSDNYGNFMPMLWNNDFSNRVVWVPSGPDWLKRVEATGAMWAQCAYGDSTCAQLSAKDSGWTEIGPLNPERWTAVYRRTRW
jgi:hypothetical protein